MGFCACGKVTALGNIIFLLESCDNVEAGAYFSGIVCNILYIYKHIRENCLNAFNIHKYIFRGDISAVCLIEISRKSLSENSAVEKSVFVLKDNKLGSCLCCRTAAHIPLLKHNGIVGKLIVDDMGNIPHNSACLSKLIGSKNYLKLTLGQNFVNLLNTFSVKAGLVVIRHIFRLIEIDCRKDFFDIGNGNFGFKIYQCKLILGIKHIVDNFKEFLKLFILIL